MEILVGNKVPWCTGTSIEHVLLYKLLVAAITNYHKLNSMKK
jgi:hypothetical protein